MRPYLHLAWLDKRDVENHITDRPHPAANPVRIASAAFPSTIESPTVRKHSINSSITNKEHLDRRPIPDNDQVHAAGAFDVDFKTNVAARSCATPCSSVFEGQN